MLLIVLKFSIIYLFAICVIWIFKKHRKFQSFKRRNINGPRPNLFFGNHFALKNSPDKKLPHEVMGEWIEKYGDIFGYYSPNRCRLVVNDAHLLRKISVHKAFQDRESLVIDIVPLRDSLFGTGGETWRRSRKTISPLLSRFRVDSPPLTSIISQCVESYLEHLRPKNVDEGAPFIVDIVDNIHRFTFDIICRTSLGMESNCYSENDQLVKSVVEFFDNAFNNAVLLSEAFPLFSHLLKFINNYLTSGKMTNSIVANLKNQIRYFIEFKSAQSGDDEPGKPVFLESMLKFLVDGKLSQQELIGNIYLIVLAGFEATANALIFCLYSIAEHQHVQDKMRESLTELVEEESYTEMVWLETLRCYPPPLFIINREASEEVNIDGLTIEKGWIVEAPIWQIHHSERYWPDPWTFDPERFSSSNRKNIVPLSFLPYGFGGRTCLGMHLANAEARKLLSSIISKYRITFCEKTMNPLRFKVPTAVLNPEGPIFLKFEPIK